MDVFDTEDEVDVMSVLGSGTVTLLIAGGVIAALFYLVWYIGQHRIRGNHDSKDTNVDLGNFLTKSGAFKIALGFMISSQATMFVNEFINSTISPLIAHALGGGNERVRDMRIDIGGIQFEFANLIVAIIRFAVAVLVVYTIFVIMTLNGVSLY